MLQVLNDSAAIRRHPVSPVSIVSAHPAANLVWISWPNHKAVHASFNGMIHWDLSWDKCPVDWWHEGMIMIHNRIFE